MSQIAKNAIAREYQSCAARVGQLALDQERLTIERKALLKRLNALQQQHDTMDAAEKAEAAAAAETGALAATEGLDDGRK